MFTDEDEKDVIYLQDDAIMAGMNIVGFNVNRIFIDPESSTDILFKKTMDELRLRQLKLEPFTTPLYEFKNGQVIPLGKTKLLVSIDTSPYVKTQMVDFLVVDYQISYKVLIGRPNSRVNSLSKDEVLNQL